MTEPIPIDLRLIRDEFDRREPQYRQAAAEVEFALGGRLAEMDIKVHTLTTRIKKRESFVDKIGRNAYSAPFEQVQDIAGIRVVCLFLSDLQRVGGAIRDLFDIESEDDKILGVDAQTFGYMSIHYIGRIKQSHQGPRYDAIRDVVFEIQVRTILMDAWANVSHHLDYKGDGGIPSSLRRDFNALSGLFYVADQHFELFFNQSAEEQIVQAEKVELGSTQDVEVNRDTVMALIQLLYPSRRPVDGASYAEFAEELQAVGYSKLAQVEAVILKGAESAESQDQEADTGPQFFTDLGMARVSITSVDENYAELLHEKGARENP